MALVGNAVRSRSRRALTLVEVLIVVVGLVLVVFVVLPALTSSGRGRGHRQIKDAVQIRNITQGLTIFAEGNRSRYPLPSLLDANNETVEDVGRAKDTTNNIFSVLVYCSVIAPELLYCPNETDDRIKVHSGYQNANPVAAVHPRNAVWDPSLRADFTTGDGHISYATLMTDGDPSDSLAVSTGRLKQWGTTFNATEAMLGNRGPLVTGRDAKGNIAFDAKSKTLLIHGGPTTWEGNIGYNDNHVNFETRMDPTEITYRVKGGGARPDLFFFDEPDDLTGCNVNLGIWVRSGMLPSEFKGVHD